MSLSSFTLTLGVLYYVYGFPLVFADEKHVIWRKKMMKDENILRFLGTLLIILAVNTLRRQSELTVDGEGFVVLIAWLALLKGLFIAWWPAQYSKLMESINDTVFDSQASQMFLGFVCVLIGALFTYLGLVLA